jgi:hypothetical protein
MSNSLFISSVSLLVTINAAKFPRYDRAILQADARCTRGEGRAKTQSEEENEKGEKDKNVPLSASLFD